MINVQRKIYGISATSLGVFVDKWISQQTSGQNMHKAPNAMSVFRLFRL
jgi:hypothetical protein